MASESGRPSHPPPPSSPVFTLFIDSNIDTHIALSASPADTVADVKRKIMIEHMLCFPDVGQVSIQALKVKRKGAFYNLSDTMPVRCVFDGRKGTRFLQADVISKSSSEHQGGNTEHVVDDNNKQFVGGFQLQLKLSEHLNEDRPLSKNDFYIDDNMNSHENQCKLADQTGYSVPKPMNCQIESLIDMANDAANQIAAANQNADGTIHSCHLERQEIDKDAQLHALELIEQEAEFPTVPSPDMFADQVKGKKLERLAGSEVLENTTSTNVPKEEKSNKRSGVEDLHLDLGIASLSLPEELSVNLHDGNSSLMEHLANDKKKRKKKSRSSRSKPAEVDSAVPLDNHVREFFDSAKEQNNEKQPALEKSDAIGFVPDVTENNNQHSADEDSGPVDTSKKRKLLSDFNNERLPKISELNHLSSMDSMVVETRTIPVNVTLSYPEELSRKLPDADSSLIEHLTDDKRKKKKRRQSSKSQTDFPIPTDNHVKIFPSIGTEQIMEDRATLETIGFVSEVKVGNNEGTSVDNLQDVINKLVDTTEKASENVVSLKVENSSKKIASTDFNSESMVKGEHSNQISSVAGNMVESDAEKVVFANSHNNIIAEYNVAPVVKEAVPFSNTRKKRSRKSLSKDVSDINEPAEFADKEKEALSRDDMAKLELENPSADNDGKSHSMRARKSKKIDSKNLSKDVSDINEDAELAINRKEAPNQYDTAKLQSENPSSGDDGKSHGKRTRKSEKVGSKKLSKDVPNINEPAGFANNQIEALSQDDTAKLQSENPSADNDGKSRRRRTRQTEKSDSKNLSKDVADINEAAELAVNQKEAPNQYDTAKLQSENPSTDDGKSNSKRTRKSEKVDSKNLSKGAPDINEPAGFANNRKESFGQDDTAKLQSENPSADNDGKSCRRRTRQSEKSDSKNLSKDVSDIHAPAELANNQKEAPDQYDTARLQSENPSAVDDGKSHRKRTRKSEKVDSKKLSKDVSDINEPAGFANNQKEALGQDDTAKLQAENPSADNDGKSCHRRTRQSEKVDSMNFESDNSKAVLSSENLVKGYHKDKSNQDQQALRDSAFPTKSDDKKSHRKKKKSSDVVLQDSEPPPKDSSNSLVGKDAGGTATGRLSKESIPLATDDEAAASGRSAKGHDYGKGGALSTTVENLTDQLPKNIASQGTEESVEAHKGEKFPGVDNDDINFIAVFRPNSIQDEPGVSAGQVLPAETKPKKQPKSKRKNKLNKHESAHDFAYPSQSKKLDVKKSSTNCDLVNQDSVDPSGKSSSELCQNGKEHNDSFNLTTDSTRDDGRISSDFTPHVGSVKQTIESNRPDTYHHISESQLQNGNHGHDSNEKTFLESATESHVPVEKEENFNLGVHAVQNQSKPSAGTFEEETHAGLAASSDSTEENTPVQAKRYRLAVRKVPRSMGKKSNNHEPETSFLIPSAIFNDVVDESSEDDVIFRNSEATAATSDSSSTDSEGSKTPRHHGKHEGSDGEDIFQSQSSQISTKNMPLDTILKSSSSYKRAKLLASQSQADDSESQPVDVATQPESD